MTKIKETIISWTKPKHSIDICQVWYFLKAQESRIGPPADWPQPADDGYEQLDIDMTLGLPPSNSLLDFYPAQSNLSIK